MEEAARRGTVIQYLLTDAGQKEQWPKLKPLLKKGQALYFSHGFSIVYSDQTGVVPPKEIDVIQIGRASCRERVEISVVAVSLKKERSNWAQVAVRVGGGERTSARAREARYLD